MDQMQSTTDVTPVITAPPLEPPQRPGIAPALHTLVLLALLLGMSLLGANSQHKFSSQYGKSALYLATIAWEWVMVGYIWLGIRRRTSLRELIGRRWQSVEDALLDFGLGVGLWVAIIALLAVLAFSMGMVNTKDTAHAMQETKDKLGFIMPATNLELLLFMAVSATAGICEEIIFRGYFQKQFVALTHSAIAGAVIQALIFGAAHGYEGGKRMAMIAAEGLLFGVVALWRRSLRPGMVAHFTQDAVGGIVGRVLLR
jgi:membrane protease YdiL (CAAX protease family)